MIIAVDFDGTCVTHAFPKVGKDIGAVPVLKALSECGHKLILCTMRDARSLQNTLQDAVDWFENNGIPLYGVNYNPQQKSWTLSPKIYANLYIDDAALGIPLKYDETLSGRPFVDWEKVEQFLKERGIIYE